MHRYTRKLTIYTPMIYTALVGNAFDAGSIHYEGKWEGIGPWKTRVFLPPVKWLRGTRLSARFGVQITRDFQGPRVDFKIATTFTAQGHE